MDELLSNHVLIFKSKEQVFVVASARFLFSKKIAEEEGRSNESCFLVGAMTFLTTK